MKIIVLLAAAALAWPVWAQAPAPENTEVQKQAEKPAATPAKSASAPKAHKVRKVSGVSARRQQDARHCLERPNNDAIIRCAEEYL